MTNDLEPTETRALATRHGPFELGRFRRRGAPESLALVRGNVRGEAPLLARVHSSCVTSEFLGALDCDCAEQLGLALAEIAAAGRGVLLYLMQEGRGAGLLAKARDRMMVQAHGERISTFDAFDRMGLPRDQRSYEGVPALLAALGVRAPLRLLTHNPEKARRLAAAGVRIEEMLPLPPAHSPWNAHYLAAKAEEGHALSGEPGRRAQIPEPVRWFEPHALAELPRFVRAASYLLPVAEAGWLRAQLYWDRETARERLVLEPLATTHAAAPLRVVQAQRLVDRLPLAPCGTTRDAWRRTAEAFGRGHPGRALVLDPDESAPSDGETLRLLEVAAA